MPTLCAKSGPLQDHFFELDLGSVGDSEPEIGGGLDVARLTAFGGKRLELVLGAELLDELPADGVEGNGVGRREHGLVGRPVLGLLVERTTVVHDLERV